MSRFATGGRTCALLKVSSSLWQQSEGRRSARAQTPRPLLSHTRTLRDQFLKIQTIFHCPPLLLYAVQLPKAPYPTRTLNRLFPKHRLQPHQPPKGSAASTVTVLLKATSVYSQKRSFIHIITSLYIKSTRYFTHHVLFLQTSLPKGT